MAHSPRGQAFEDFKPTITQEDIQQAYAKSHMVVSFDSKPVLDPAGSGMIQFLAIKLFLGDETTPTILVDPLSAAGLYALFGGAASIQWDGSKMKGSATEH